MPRRLLIALLVAGLAPGTWLRSAVEPDRPVQAMTALPIPLPRDCCAIGPLKADAAWHLTSPNRQFSGFSALVASGDGTLLALSDFGSYARFTPPEPANHGPVRIGVALPSQGWGKRQRDVESATWDPGSRRLWLGLEGAGLILRRSADLAPDGQIRVAAMRAWPGNKGPEAMVRLRTGRFVVLGETYSGWLETRRHPALLFAGDPVAGAAAQPFTFVGYPGYRPTDMAELPDGRVLIVMRRLRWPFPIRFAARLMLADPRAIRPGGEWRGIDLGEIASPLPLDNYEGLALVPARDGMVTGWLISDDNGAALQRTLLLRLRIDPARLPHP